jgi:hypothetical protein
MRDSIKLKKSRNWKAYLIIGIIILLIAAVYFTFFFYYSCDDLACFQAHQKECAKTKFINDEEETTWKYTIQGKEGDKCEINVEVLNIKKGSANKQKLEGKDMNCLLPLGSIALPEADLARCHGELKEDMQNLIIQKLHAYIIENVEEIHEELEELEEIL